LAFLIITEDMRFKSVAMGTVALMLSGLVRAAEPMKATGTVLPYRQVELASSSEGVITGVPVREGSSVTQGQVLVQLDASRELMESEYYRELMNKRATDLKAAESLFNDKVLSRTQWEERQVDAKLAETQYRMALGKLDDRSIKSPFPGLALRIYKERGESIHNLERVAELISIDKLYVVVYFDGADILRVKPGQRAQVTIPIAGQEAFPGVVETVDPVVDPSSGVFRVKIVVDNPDHRIRSGVKANVVLGEDVANASKSK
jgi:membrane fusion protein, multidrug efflux system